MEVFFEELKEITSLVQMEVAFEVQHANNKLDELPSHFTGRHMYYQLSNNFGYKASLRNDQGAIELKEIAEFEREQQIKPPYFKAFQVFWRIYYSKLVIPNAREDVCNDCFSLWHMFCYYSTRVACQRADGIEEIEDNKDKINHYKSQEVAVQLALVHVECAKAQRKYFNEISSVPGGNVIACDFMQNLGLPYLGFEQSGATYYYLPLTVFVFGVVNIQTKHLHRFVYNKGKGEKGGNNIASMLYKYLQIYGMLQNDGSKLLKVVVDNCLGQNKVSAVGHVICGKKEKKR